MPRSIQGNKARAGGFSKKQQKEQQRAAFCDHNYAHLACEVSAQSQSTRVLLQKSCAQLLPQPLLLLASLSCSCICSRSWLNHDSKRSQASPRMIKQDPRTGVALESFSLALAITLAFSVCLSVPPFNIHWSCIVHSAPASG